MLKLSRVILSAARERRSMAVGIALRLLRSVRDVEKDESYRLSDLLDKFDQVSENVSRRRYTKTEDEYLNSEHALDALESAIEDLEFAYEGRV